MSAHPGIVSHRRAVRLALAVAGPALAAFVLAVGVGLLLDARAGEGLARIGLGPGLRLLLGVSHVAGGVALLAPSLVEPATILLGFVVSGMAAYLLALGQGVMAGGSALTAVVLAAYGVSTRFRNRAAETAWWRMLLRYAEQSDARGSAAGLIKSGSTKNTGPTAAEPAARPSP